jgi:hypothetical protein
MVGVDKSAVELERRLRSALDAPLDPSRDGVDMSAAAITRRLRDAAEMSSLCIELARLGEST